MRSIVIFLLLLGLAAGAQASPCSGCPSHSQPPYPQAGFWYDPDRPGTGFSLDIQGGTLAAAYYGFDADGNNLWYIVNGPLSRATEEQTYWELEAPLLRFADGESLGGEYRDPAEFEAGRIHIQFLQRNLLRFSVDGGEWRSMVSLIYGTGMNTSFPQHSALRLPVFGDIDDNLHDRQKPWIIIETDPAQLELPGASGRNQYGQTSSLIHWADSVAPPPGRTLHYMDFAVYEDFHFSPDRVTIVCGLPADLPSTYQAPGLANLDPGEPVCMVRVVAGAGYRFYYMPMGDLGDRRFKAVDEEGRVIEGFRLNYD